MSDQYNANLVRTSVPKSVTPVQPSSASKFILSRRFKRFLPDQSGQTFTEGGIKSIRFTINDSTGFWKPKSHFLKFKVTVSGTDAQKYLDVGGASALFQRVSLRTASGSRIEERDYYNLFESIKKHVMDSPECVEYYGHAEGDSMGSTIHKKSNIGFPYAKDDAGAPVVLATANGMVTDNLISSTAVTFAAGDFLEVDGQVYKVAGAGVTAGVNIPVQPDPVALYTNLTDLDGLDVYVADMTVPRRVAVANGGTIEITHKIDLGMLMGDWYLPLPMLKNLQLELDLAKPEFSCISPVNATDLDVSISDPELICEIVEFDRSVVDQYKELFNGGGIAYPFKSYRYNNRSLTGTGNEVQVYANVRSAHSIINVITDGTLITADAAARQAESISTFKKYQMSEYEVLSGSERKPFFGPVRMDDSYAITAYKEARKAFMMDNKSNMVQCGRIHPSDLIGTDSNKFIFGTVLGREDGDEYAGLDLTNEQLQLKMTFGDGAQKYLHSFLIHSLTLNISSDGVIIRS